MKRLMFLLLFLSLLTLSVNASGLSMKTSVVDNLIMVGEEALFDITLTNEQEVSDRLTFVISDLDWIWEKEFIDINPGETKLFQLKIKAPEGTINPGLYSLNLKVYSILKNDVYVYEPLLVTVIDDSNMLKLEKIDYQINGLDPERRNNVIKLIVKNQYDKPVENVHIMISSDIFGVYERDVDFAEAELRNEEFDVYMNVGVSEGWHDVSVVLKKENNVLLDETRKVRVGRHSDIKEDKEIISGFLVKRINIARKNEGSVLSEEIYRLRLNSFERLFSNVNPNPSHIEKSDNDYYYIWDFNLNPGESYEINIEINYRDPLALLIILGIIAYVIIYLSENGISISKKVLTIKSKEGITSMKILLLIRNKGKREIKNVRIVDQLLNAKTIPSDYGTLRPSRVNRNGENVIMVWDVLSLIGKEERIISYRVNVGVKNRIILPRALVKYKIGRKSYIVKSNHSLVVA